MIKSTHHSRISLFILIISLCACAPIPIEKKSEAKMDAYQRFSHYISQNSKPDQKKTKSNDQEEKKVLSKKQNTSDTLNKTIAKPLPTSKKTIANLFKKEKNHQQQSISKQWNKPNSISNQKSTQNKKNREPEIIESKKTLNQVKTQEQPTKKPKNFLAKVLTRKNPQNKSKAKIDEPSHTDKIIISNIELSVIDFTKKKNQTQTDWNKNTIKQNIITAINNSNTFKWLPITNKNEKESSAQASLTTYFKRTKNLANNLKEIKGNTIIANLILMKNFESKKEKNTNEKILTIMFKAKENSNDTLISDSSKKINLGATDKINETIDQLLPEILSTLLADLADNRYDLIYQKNYAKKQAQAFTATTKKTEKAIQKTTQDVTEKKSFFSLDNTSKTIPEKKDKDPYISQLKKSKNLDATSKHTKFYAIQLKRNIDLNQLNIDLKKIVKNIKESNKVQVVRQKHKDIYTYIALYGEYKSANEAQKALYKLPKIILDEGAFVRTIHIKSNPNEFSMK